MHNYIVNLHITTATWFNPYYIYIYINIKYIYMYIYIYNGADGRAVG